MANRKYRAKYLIKTQAQMDQQHTFLDSTIETWKRNKVPAAVIEQMTAQYTRQLLAHVKVFRADGSQYAEG